MSYAIPTDTVRTGTCAYVQETTPCDIWTPVGSIAPGLTQAISMRGIGYYRRRVVVHTVGEALLTALMAGIKENEDAITFDGQTYSVQNIADPQVLCSNDSRDVAKQCLVTIELWRP